MRAVDGHYIQASDGDLGHVSDFIVDDSDWFVRYLEVHTRNWLPGKHVLVSPQWIREVSWGKQKVYVNLAKDQIKGAPEHQHGSVVAREYEEALYKYYHRPGYWRAPEPAAKR